LLSEAQFTKRNASTQVYFYPPAYVLLMVLKIFLVIRVRLITSTFTGLIFTKFAGLVELNSVVHFDIQLFFDPSRDVALATNFVGKTDLHSTPCSSHDIR